MASMHGVAKHSAQLTELSSPFDKYATISYQSPRLLIICISPDKKHIRQSLTSGICCGIEVMEPHIQNCSLKDKISET